MGNNTIIVSFKVGKSPPKFCKKNVMFTFRYELTAQRIETSTIVKVLKI